MITFRVSKCIFTALITSERGFELDEKGFDGRHGRSKKLASGRPLKVSKRRLGSSC